MSTKEELKSHHSIQPFGLNQLCRGEHPLQQQKYAKEHTADSLRRGISFALPSRAFASSECACNQILPLMSGVNYFFALTTTISPYRIASPRNVTEVVAVVVQGGWSGPGTFQLNE
jgi:hypothetical protein